MTLEPPRFIVRPRVWGGLIEVVSAATGEVCARGTARDVPRLLCLLEGQPPPAPAWLEAALARVAAGDAADEPTPISARKRKAA